MRSQVRYLPVLRLTPARRLADVIDGVIREELGKSARELFATFSEAPIAAASLAQVHTATLRDGTPVAVKVQYPELRLNMASDLSVFRTMGAQVCGLLACGRLHKAQASARV